MASRVLGNALGEFSVTISATNAVDDGPEETLFITVIASLLTVDPNLTDGTVSIDATGGGSLIFEFIRSSPVANDVSFFIETSSDLSDWTSVTLGDQSLDVTLVDGGYGTETVKVVFSIDSPIELPAYVRYRVVKAE